jgi:hypothetical protein
MSIRPGVLLLAAVMTAASLFLSPALPEALACSCLPADLPTIYNQSDAVLRVRILAERTRPGGQIVYTARVVTTYKGCAQKRQILPLVTAPNDGLCGVRLDVGGDYLVTGSRRGRGRAIQIGTCGFNVPFRSLSPDEREFVDTRFHCCGETCACVKREPVQCFVDPCEVASCPDGACTSNYCGGCRAEFTTPDGANVCQPCTSDDDCPLLGQTCDAEGICRLG